MTETSFIEVVIAVAVSDCGLSMVSLIDNNNIHARKKHQQWLDALKTDNRLWSVKTIKTFVPLPVQYEEIDLQPSGQQQ
jgi:hypothetical protein